MTSLVVIIAKYFLIIGANVCKITKNAFTTNNVYTKHRYSAIIDYRVNKHTEK